MSLEDKLLQLDKAIWHQHEKVTQKAQKELGWNKYDLAKICNKASVVSYMGVGIYMLIYGLETSSISYCGCALFDFYVSHLTNTVQKSFDWKEKMEYQQIISSGTTSPPSYNSFRPILSFVPPLIVSIGGYYLVNYNNENSLYLNIGLNLICASAGFFFLNSSSYFGDQILTPPTKKKSFWKTLYEKATSPLRPKQLVPSPEQTPYQTIDGIVE